MSSLPMPRPAPERPQNWPLFLHAYLKIVESVEKELADAGLPGIAWYDVLQSLEEVPEGRLRMSELAERVMLSRSNLTRLVDRLEDAGYLKREMCRTDRRGFFAIATESGLALRQRMEPLYRQSVRRHFDQFIDDREAAAMERVLRKLLRQSKR